MLVNVTSKFSDDNIHLMCDRQKEVWNGLSDDQKQYFIPVFISTGIYDFYTGNAEDMFLEDVTSSPYGNLVFEPHEEPTLQSFLGRGCVSSYGICDSVEDILNNHEYMEILNSKTRKFTILVCTMGEDWNWNKWGPYIGSKIDREGTFLCFSILEHRQSH